jgi:hypothetical protein
LLFGLSRRALDHGADPAGGCRAFGGQCLWRFTQAGRGAALSIFKPSGNTWRLGKYDQTTRAHFQAKWKHLATRKMRSNNARAFSSQVETLGGSENTLKHKSLIWFP